MAPLYLSFEDADPCKTSFPLFAWWPFSKACSWSPHHWRGSAWPRNCWNCPPRRCGKWVPWCWSRAWRRCGGRATEPAATAAAAVGLAGVVAVRQNPDNPQKPVGPAPHRAPRPAFSVYGLGVCRMLPDGVSIQAAQRQRTAPSAAPMAAANSGVTRHGSISCCSRRPVGR